MSQPVLHQISTGATPGDAITDHALTIRRWLREMGYRSELFAEFVHPALAGEVRPAQTYQPGRDERWVIFHHSIGSPVAARLLALPTRLVLVYHNVTPPEFFAGVHPVLARQMEEGRSQLHALRGQTDLALGVSSFNEAELRAVGFAPTGVLPLALDERAYGVPNDPALEARLRGGGPTLLFVGRQVPNKRQEDLLKLLYFYRRIEPAARLALVGERWLPEYERWLREFARDLGLADAVTFTGHVSHQQLVTCYRLADLYVSMSEHEGFGKPLIESMLLGLPVLAYAAAGVPSTLGGAGVLARHKHWEALAEVVHWLVSNQPLRARLVAAGRQRVQEFLEPQVREQLRQHLARLEDQPVVAVNSGR